MSYRDVLRMIAREAKRERANADSDGVRDAFARIVVAAEDGLQFGSCKHCGMNVDIAYDCCASCADTNGP